MKINASQHINNQSFGSKRIFQVKLNDIMPDLSVKKVDAYISEIVKQDDSNIENLLGKLAQTRWGKEIVEMLHGLSHHGKTDIPQNVKFYMVECPKKLLGEQILAIAKADINEGNIFIDRLNSRRELTPTNAISGAGSCLMYAYTKLAQLLDKNSVSLESSTSAIPFYEKLNFKRAYTDGRKDFFLSQFDFSDFLPKLEEKFSIIPIK